MTSVPHLPSCTLKELAQWVSALLSESGITAALVGGACVTLYSENRYQSYDLDFVSHRTIKEVEKVLLPYGFKRCGRCFKHADCPYLLDFIHPPIAVGNQPVREFEQMGSIRMLTPTDCIKDRLAAYYYWADLQALEQAVMVAAKQPFDLADIRKWSEEEGFLEKCQHFIRLLE